MDWLPIYKPRGMNEKTVFTVESNTDDKPLTENNQTFTTYYNT